MINPIHLPHGLRTGLAAAAALLLVSVASQAQNTQGVTPATLPIPLPGASPLSPDKLRGSNPWNLPMTGQWRFALTHGQIVGGQFEPADNALWGLETSTSQSGHPAQDAFDGDSATRWCADSSSYPQWITADLRQTLHVTGITLAWETGDHKYRFKIDGSSDGKTWTTLADASTGPGVGDGPVAVGPADVRFVKLTVLSDGGGGWASLREIQIHVAGPNGDTIWKPTKMEADNTHVDDFAGLNFDDSHWNNLAVPSNWEIAGYSIPTYNSVDDTVGLYRRWVVVPKTFANRRVYWRFDGAMDGAEVYVNGTRAGYHESGFTAFDVDITDLVKPGVRNLFAVRVTKTTPSVDCETGDFQCLGGIYRETSLICVPRTNVSDITVRTPLSANYRDATFHADLIVHGTPGARVSLTGALLGVDGSRVPVSLTGSGNIDAQGSATVPLSAFVAAPRLWSAEKPNLYYSVFQLSVDGKPSERVEQRFGFREVEIKNNIVLWNGRAIKCEGTCRHDFWADKGFALTDKEWNQDLTMMKNANINAIRTSHYNHAARFLELCEEKGFYILDEVPFCWINEKNNDPAFAPALLARAADTLGRDKNRPCVLAWSLGNENGVGKNSQTVIDFVKNADPTRPAFISQGGYWGPKGQSFQDMHYPTPKDVDNYIKNDSGKLPAQFSEQPHIMYQKKDQDYDPGTSDLWSEALGETWDKIWKSPTIVGSYVWEWQNQGIADKNPDRTRDFWYGADYMRQENNKGIVSAYRVPKPEYWIVKMVYSPVVIEAKTVAPNAGICTVPLANRYTFTDLKELSCHWTATKGQSVLASGVSRIPCAPNAECSASFPAPAGMTGLHLEFDRADGTSVTLANLPVAGAPLPAPPVGMTGGSSLTSNDRADALTLSDSLQSITFDKQTGSISSWRVRGKDVIVGGSVLNIGQGKEGNEKGYFGAAQPPVLSAVTVHATPGTDGAVQVQSMGSVASDTGAPLGSLTCTYTVSPNAEVQVDWSLAWSAAPTLLWESGLKLNLPAAYSHMAWWRDSYFSAYPVGHIGEPTGTCTAGDVLFRASKRGLHWMTLTDASGNGIALLENNSPLIARAQADGQTETLLASSGLAGPKDFSYPWVASHDINAGPGKPLTGTFIIRAIGH